MVRSFFAIDLPLEYSEEIRRLQHRLKTAGADVKWVRPESAHLTLKFLGDVAREDIDPLGRAVGECLTGCPALSLSLRDVGVFPGPSRPRVVWLGLSGDLDHLATLHQRVEIAAAELGFPRDKRPFQPHLTLGRVRSGRGRERLIKEIGRIDIKPLEFIARDVILFKSDLKPTGAVHTVLHQIPLGTGSTMEG